MGQKFTNQEVIEGIENVKTFAVNRSDSEVYQAWAELADAWLADSAGDYHWDGFRGFNQRTAEELLEDFRLNDLLSEQNEPVTVIGNASRHCDEEYVVQLSNNGTMELDIEDGIIRYRDVDGNTENIHRSGEDDYLMFRRMFSVPTLVDLREALQEAQDNFNAETGSRVQHILDTLPDSINADLVDLKEEFEWVFEQVDR